MSKELEDLTDVVDPGLRGHLEPSGEVVDIELRDQRAPDATQEDPIDPERELIDPCRLTTPNGAAEIRS